MKTDETALTVSEQQALQGWESVIENGMKTFIAVGNALLQIRDLRLYRQNYNTFEDYCRSRWGMNRAHAYRLIDAANVADNLSPIGDRPINEAQARPLTRLEPEQQREAWKEAVATAPDGKVTAAHVQAVVDAYTETEKAELIGPLDADPPSVYNAKMLWHACKADEKRKVAAWLLEYFPKFFRRAEERKNSTIMKELWNNMSYKERMNFLHSIPNKDLIPPKPKGTYANIRNTELVDPAFDEAWRKLYDRLIGMGMSKWRTMKKETAQRYIDMLSDFLKR